MRDTPGQQTSENLISRDELLVEQQKHKVTLQALNDAKKQLEEFSLRSPVRAVPPSSFASSTPSSRSRLNQENALNVLRQSSVTQQELTLKITELETKLEEAKKDAEVKATEMEQLRQESTKKVSEVNAVNAALLKDLRLLKDDRERQQENERNLRYIRRKSYG